MVVLRRSFFQDEFSEAEEILLTEGHNQELLKLTFGQVPKDFEILIYHFDQTD